MKQKRFFQAAIFHTKKMDCDLYYQFEHQIVNTTFINFKAWNFFDFGVLPSNSVVFKKKKKKQLVRLQQYVPKLSLI